MSQTGGQSNLQVLLAGKEGLAFAYCPYHEDKNTPNLAIYPTAVHCFACGAHVTAEEFLASGIKLRIARRSSSVQERVEYLPPSLALAYHQLLLTEESSRKEWLYARGLSDETICRALLGHTGCAFTIPVWRMGELYTIKYRRDDAYSSLGPKYWGLYRRGGAVLYDPANCLPRRSVVLCEGELDALLLVQYGIAAVSPLFGARSLYMAARQLLLCHRVYVCSDQDDEGDRAFVDVKNLLGQRAVRVRWDGAKDVTELISQYGIEAFRGALWKSLR